MTDRCLVVGSYPPVPGPASAATLAAVRRCWERQAEVVVASPRPSAAAEVVGAPGTAAARRVQKLAAEHGCTQLVLCLEPGWPFLAYDRQPRLGPWYPDLKGRAARAWGNCLASFDRVELVVTGAPALTPRLLAHLVPTAAALTAGSPTDARRMKALGFKAVSVHDPGWWPAPGVLEGAVAPLEPGSLLLAARARRLAGTAARRALGDRAPVVRAKLAKARQKL